MKWYIRSLCNIFLVLLHIAGIACIEMTFAAKALFFYEWTITDDITLIVRIVFSLAIHYIFLKLFRRHCILSHHTALALLIFDLAVSITFMVLLFFFISINTSKELVYCAFFIGGQLAILLTRLYSYFHKTAS